MKQPFDSASASVGRGVGVLLSRTRALSRSMTRSSRSANENNNADVTVLPSTGVVVSGGAPQRTTSWKIKSSSGGKAKTRFGSGKAELLSLSQTHKLRNVRETKIVELTDREGYLTDVEFDNKGLSLDELQLAAVLMLERAAPSAAFADKAGFAKLFAFVDSLRAAYKSNPYHDFRHAVDVAQFMNHLLSQDDIAERVLNPASPASGFPRGDEMKFLLLIACLCHDVGHNGTSNAYLRKTNDELIQKFGSESTLERLHASLAESLIESSGILDVLSETPNLAMDATQFLREVRSLILATDMEKHAALLSTFKASPSAQLLNVLIKIADISNVTRNFEEAKVWARRLEAEVRLLSQKSAASAPPPPLSSTVIGFSKMFALPLVDAITDTGMQDTGRNLRARIEKNIASWESFSGDSLNPGL